MDWKSIEDRFIINDWLWNFDSGPAVPNEEDIKQLVGQAVERLSQEDGDAQLEVGRLLIKKNDGIFDVYIYQGTV